MIHVLLLQIKLCLFLSKVNARQKWLQDQNGLQSKLSDSQMCVPAEVSCQLKLATSQKMQDQNGFYPILAVKIGCQKSLYQRLPSKKNQNQNQNQKLLPGK